MRKIIFVFILLILSNAPCYAWLEGYEDYNFFREKVEPKLDVIFDSVMDVAEKVIIMEKPLFEVQLTNKERYFEKDTMEFLGIEPAQARASYSGVLYLGVWYDGKTIIKGWAKKDRKFHVYYIYTIDTELIFAGNIHVGARNSVLSDFFNINLYDMCVEYGSLGHLEEVLPNDICGVSTVLIEYNNGIIKSIKAKNDYVPNDKVPIVPTISRIDNFVNDKIEELSLIPTPQTSAKPIIVPLKLDTASETSALPKTSTLSMTAIIVIGIMMLLLGELFCVVLALFVNDLDNAQSEADEQLNDETIDEMFEYDEDI